MLFTIEVKLKHEIHGKSMDMCSLLVCILFVFSTGDCFCEDQWLKYKQLEITIVGK